MHYIDRGGVGDAPVELLNSFIAKKQKDWAVYNTARINKDKPLPPKPASLWLHDDIRRPLKKLFLKNCGYCGVHADEGRDAEVDHFYPTSKDGDAEYVFDWNNYIWSCPSCNGLKSNSYPFLNPCSKDEMDCIYFHPSDGKYLLLKATPASTSEKYTLTEDNSNLNSKNRPNRRKHVYRCVVRLLDEIKIDYMMYTVECSASGNGTAAADKHERALDERKGELLDLIRSGDYLFLIQSTISEFCLRNDSFPYNFSDLLVESGYL